MDEISVDTLPMSYEDYLEWAEVEERRHSKWVDGEVIPFMAISDRHERIVKFLHQIIGNYLDLKGPGRAFGQEFELWSRPGAAPEPDMFVVLRENLDLLENLRFVGAADAVAEVISPDSVMKDQRVKFAEY